MKFKEIVANARDINEVIEYSLMIGPLMGIMGNAKANVRLFLSDKFQIAIMKAKTPQDEKLLFDLWVAITGETQTELVTPPEGA